MSGLFVGFTLSPNVPAKPAGAAVDGVSSNSLPREADHSDDLSLMQRLGAGDESAMNSLIQQHAEKLARLVGRLMAWSPDHEDVFQDVLLHVWQKANSYCGTGPLEGWLRRVAINRCHNHLRGQNSIRNLLAGFFESKRNGETCHSHVESTMQIALAALSATDRMVLVLFYLEEMSGDEVAQTMRIKPATLHVRLHRARQKLKSILTTDGEI